MCEHCAGPLIRAAAPVLRRVSNLGGEVDRGMPNPARVIEKGAGERYAIGLAVCDYRLRLYGIDDHSDDLHGDTAGLFDRGSKRHLVSRRNHRTRLGLMPPEDTQT